MNQKWNWITQIRLEENWRGLEPSNTKKLSRLTIAELKEKLTMVKNASSASKTNEVAQIQTIKV